MKIAAVGAAFVTAVTIVANLAQVGSFVIDLFGMFGSKFQAPTAPAVTVTIHPTPASREENAIYQNGEIVARISGAIVIDESQGQILFEEIFNSNSLDLESEFEFQRWRLILRGYESFTGSSSETIIDPDGPSHVNKESVFGNVECEIVGVRTQ